MPVPIPPLSLGFSTGPSTAVSGNAGDFRTGNSAPLIQNGTDLNQIATYAIIGGVVLVGFSIVTGSPKKRRRKRKR